MKYDIDDAYVHVYDDVGWYIDPDKAVEAYKAANRYEALRKLSPQQFTELWKRSLTGEKSFDTLVDELSKEQHHETAIQRY